jgi:hypothetical protein
MQVSIGVILVLITSLPSANSGLVGGKDWARWDPEGYSAMLKTYLKFIHAGFLGKWRWTRLYGQD